LLELAARVDPGFDLGVFVVMLDSLARFSDAEVPVPAGRVPALREFFTRWRGSLSVQ
jgi:hypothetical protein